MNDRIRRYIDVPPLLTLREADEAGSDPNTLSGHAAVYYDGTEATEFDAHGFFRERIMPGAFARMLADGDDVRALFNHDVTLLLGRRSAGTLELRDDKQGLWYQVELPPTQVGRDVWELVRRGDIRGNSFSFIATDERETKDNGVRVREITSVKVLDVGPVTFPAYESTDVQARSLEEAQAWVERHEQCSPRRGRSISILRRRLELDTRQRS